MKTTLWLAFLSAAHAVDECPAAPEGSTYASEPPCYFPTDFLEVPVKAVRQDTHDSKVITFGLPEGVSLALSVSSAIVMNAPGVGQDGKDVAKPYNPISPGSVLGSFDILVKVYEAGQVSKYAGDLKVGDRVSFKQVKPNVKPFRYPFVGVERITMLAGGTGIAPMLQALYPILETVGDKIQVRLLYGNKSPDDIMLKTELDLLATKHPDRFSVTYIVGEEESDERAIGNFGWAGEVGWIDEDKVKRLAFPLAQGNVVWVCGVDDMYVTLAGSRMKPLAPSSVLHNLGFSDEMVWRS